VSTTNILSGLGPGLSSVSVSRQMGIPLSLASTVTSLSSATSPTSAAATQTTPAYLCADNDEGVVSENGYEWVLSCQNDTSGSIYSSRLAANTFNDCFMQCDQSSTNGGAQYCTTFTYVGVPGGNGPGVCYLKNSVGETTIPGPRHYVAAVRLVNYAGRAAPGAPSNTYPPAASPSNVVSIPTGSASAPSLSVGVPTTGPSVSMPTASPTLNPTVPVNTDGISSIVAGANGVTTAGVPPTTCSNGGNILNGCVLVTGGPVVSAGAGVGLGVSSSTILNVQASVVASLSVSVDLGLGVSASLGSSRLGLGVSATAGAGLGGTLGAGLSGMLGGLGGTSTSVPALPTVTSPTISTTTIQSVTTVTSCSTGLSSLVTCPGGLTISSVRSISVTVPTSSCSSGVGGVVTCVSTSIITQVAVTTTVTSSSLSTTTRSSTSTSSTRSSTSTKDFEHDFVRWRGEQLGDLCECTCMHTGFDLLRKCKLF